MLLLTDLKTCLDCGTQKTRADFPMYKTGPRAGKTAGGHCKNCNAIKEAVRRRRIKPSITSPVNRVSSAQKLEFIRLYTEDGLTCNQIGALFGFKGRSVKYHLKASGVPIKPASAWLGVSEVLITVCSHHDIARLFAH